MKRFDFSLQKVLDLRSFEEDNAKIELGKAISISDKIRLELELVAQKRIQNAQKRGSSTDILYLQTIENFINRLDLRKEELLEELARAELVVEEKRAFFAQAMQKRKVLDKLKERKKIDYRHEKNKAEESAVDDLNSRENDR